MSDSSRRQQGEDALTSYQNGLIPMVIESSGRGERSYDIFSLLLQNRIIILGTPINDQIANLIVAQMLYLNRENPEREIQLFINSPGGSIYSGLAIVDTMASIEAPVVTIAIGLTADISTVILASGVKGKRYVLPNATIHLHQPMGGSRGQAVDMEIQAKELLRQRALLNQILSRHTGQPLEQIARDTDRAYYMDAEAAVAYGIADEVLEHKLEGTADGSQG